jgi:hypothetical protein
MSETVTLPLEDWRTLLEFAGRMAREIAEYDDEDEEYVAVCAVLAKINQQLDENAGADTPCLVPAAKSADPAS